MSAPTTKTFGKSTRTVPHPSEKAQKWYPAEDEAKPRKVRGCIYFCRLMLGAATIRGHGEFGGTQGQFGLGPFGVGNIYTGETGERNHERGGEHMRMHAMETAAPWVDGIAGTVILGTTWF